tara:strand:+ start:3414 stop:3596 length:183 start_codon:yes stop_codon:yes gene_type:complete
MNDNLLLKELELKVKLLVSTLKREREKNIVPESLVQESDKLSKIENEIHGLLDIIKQIEL